MVVGRYIDGPGASSYNNPLGAMAGRVFSNSLVAIIAQCNRITRKTDSACRAFFTVVRIMARKQFEYSALKSVPTDERHLPICIATALLQPPDTVVCHSAVIWALNRNKDGYIA